MQRYEYLVQMKVYEMNKEQLIKLIGDLFEDNQALSKYIERLEVEYENRRRN